MGKKLNIEGQRFGKLVAIKDIGKGNGTCFLWLCKCDCGNYKIATASHLVKGNTKTCGKCLDKGTHHCSRERLYSVWQGIRRRCFDEKDYKYYLYGGRGITICDEWKDDYLAFREWALKNGYDKDAPHGECTIDRIDVNGNYEPNNCRWVSTKVQNMNKRNSIYIDIDGKKYSLYELADNFGLTRKTVRRRYERGDTGKDLIRPARERLYKNKKEEHL